MDADALAHVPHCPTCGSKRSQTYRGEVFNPLTGMDGQWKCEQCTCEYVIKWHGRSVVIRPGLSSEELILARHALAIEEHSAIIEKRLAQ